MDRFIWGRWELLTWAVDAVDAVDAVEAIVARSRFDVMVEIVTRTRKRFRLLDYGRRWTGMEVIYCSRRCCMRCEVMT